MVFELRMSIPATLTRTKTAQLQYDPELDDVGSILRDVCEALEIAGVGFLARVCSDESWPVTVRTDLLLVMEQLNDTLAALKCGTSARLDFYEQGIERTVSFTPNNEAILITCEDMIAKSTSRPEVVILPRALVIQELSCLANDFLRASRACSPELTAHPWFEVWAARLQDTLESIRHEDSD